MAEQKQQEQRSTRDVIREKTIGSKRQLRSTRREVNGVEVDIRQPTVGERNEILDLIRDENGNLDQFELLVWGVIRLTYVPDTQERVFEDQDHDAFMQQPTNDWVDELGEAVLDVLNVEKDEQGKG